MQRRLFTERSHAERHRDIIRRFGGFPHRYAILGRCIMRPEEQLKNLTRVVEAERLQCVATCRADPTPPLRGCPSTLR